MSRRNNRVTVVTLLKSVKDNHVSEKCQIKRLTIFNKGYSMEIPSFLYLCEAAGWFKI